MLTRFLRISAPLFLCIAAFLLYFQAIFFDFVNIDDPRYVLYNPLLSNFNIFYLLDLRTLTVSDWTPLVTLTHAIEHKLWGFYPGGYHFINIALHAVNAVLIYLLLQKLNVKNEVAFLAALIFVLHPLQIESVAWISSRKNLLSLCFGLLYLLFLIEKRFLKAFLFLVLALMSKGTSVVFPLIGLLILTIEGKGSLKSKPYISFFSISFFLSFLRILVSMSSQHGVVEARLTGKLDFAGRMAVMGQVLVKQVRQFFSPNDLSHVYLWLPASFSETRVWASWAAIILVSVLLFFLCRKNKTLQIGLIFFYLGLLPTFNIISAPDFQADRYFYVPLIGLSIILIEIFYNLSPKKHAVFFIFCIFCFNLFLISWFSMKRWENSETLWTPAIERYPEYSFAYFQRALYRLEKGQIELAGADLEKDISLNPTDLDGRYNLALVYRKSGKLDLADRQFREIFTQNASYQFAYPVFVKNSKELGKTEEAKSLLLELAKQNPDNPLPLKALEYIEGS